MAMNPMQRRARNSFLIGFLVALIIMAIVVFLLMMQMKKINEEKEQLLQLQTNAYVAARDFKSGDIIDFDEDFINQKVQTTVDKSLMITTDDFSFLDEDGIPIDKIDQDGNVIKKKVISKVAIPAGTIVTKDMLVESDEQTTDTDRIVEYNMISLPSHLKNGDYIDIRLTLPSGQDYIVLAKKRVLGTTGNSVWLRLNEFEIQLISSAIVESYYFKGTNLSAKMYSEPGMQSPTQITYPVNPKALVLLNRSPNIIEKIKLDYQNAYPFEDRTVFFEQPLSILPEEEKNSLVASGFSKENEAIKTERDEFVSSLEGTEDVGYNGQK